MSTHKQGKKMPQLGIVKRLEGDQAEVLTSGDIYNIRLKKYQEGIFWENEKVDVTIIGKKVVIEKKGKYSEASNSAIQETSDLLEECIEQAKAVADRVGWEEDQDILLRIATTIFIDVKRKI